MGTDTIAAIIRDFDVNHKTFAVDGRIFFLKNVARWILAMIRATLLELLYRRLSPAILTAAHELSLWHALNPCSGNHGHKQQSIDRTADLERSLLNG